MYYYRKARPDEVKPQERRLANVTVERCSSALNIGQPELNFVLESYTGDIVYQTPIVGLTRNRDVYVLTGLAPMELVRCIAHEVRHVFQRDTGKQHFNRERDAKIFEWEFTQNLNGQNYDELQAELIALKYSSFRNDARPAYTKPKPPAPVVRDVSQAPVAEIRVNKMFETVPERIQYIRNLLARLPNTAPYQNQRANLTAELNERIAQL